MFAFYFLGTTELGGCGIYLVNNKTKNYESTGIVFLDVELKILDINTNEILNHNQLGELCFKHKYMLKHYLNNPQETAKIYTSDGNNLKI